MTDIFSVRHEQQRAITNADQVELTAIQSGTAVPDAGVQDERISGALEDLETADTEMEPFQQQDVQLDDEVGAVRDELIRRADLMGEHYPFVLNGGTLSYRPSKSGFYEYSLGISTTTGSIQKVPWTKLPRSFERVAGLLLQKHLGPSWEALHTGWPRDAGEPRRFDALLQSVSKRTSEQREWVWNPEHGFPAQYTRGGDGGVDFVVWRRSPDKRIGQPYVLGQCACGNDWGTKFDDLKVEKLAPWMRPFTFVPIIRSFTTPFIISDGNFLIAHQQAGWVFDRIRLAIIAEEAAADPDVAAQIPTMKVLFDLATAA